jgi:alpha-tubulin suppressor-like RCC1 family protein
VWGKNDAGQLGLGDVKDRQLPIYMDKFRKQNITIVACGGEHSVAVTGNLSYCTWR